MAFTIHDLTETIDKNPIYAGMKSYRERIRLVLTNVMEPLLFVTGPPGIGKSHHFEEVSRKLGATYQQIAPGGDPHSFVNSIWEYRDFHALLCDDHDRLLTAAKSRELVKSGWGPTRTIHWQTKAAMTGKSAHPPEFKVTSRLIWISNHDISLEKDEDLRAIFDRGAQPLVIKGSDIDLFRYVVHAVVSDNFFKRSDGISVRAKEEALNWFVTNRNQLTGISLRTIQQAARYIQRASNEESKRVALSSLLSVKNPHDPGLTLVDGKIVNANRIPGFGKLTMVEPGVWREDAPWKPEPQPDVSGGDAKRSEPLWNHAVVNEDGTAMVERTESQVYDGKKLVLGSYKTHKEAHLALERYRVFVYGKGTDAQLYPADEVAKVKFSEAVWKRVGAIKDTMTK
jgi:hypothetical protein